jgi:hypothetical protein
MLFDLKALASALLSTTLFGATSETPEHFEIKAQPKGIDVSSHQGEVNWNAVVANGVSFAYIKATEGTSKAIVRLSCRALTLCFSLQEPLLLLSVYWRYQSRPHSWWLSLCPS